MQQGTLYLLPTPLGDDALHTLPGYVKDRVHKLEYIVAERAKTARRLIKSTDPPKPIQSYHVVELNDRTTDLELDDMLQLLKKGECLGLMSEAGCPGVADPGAKLVALSHQNDIRVVPMVGPSSILLSLMASGLNGQDFCFHGYLPRKSGELTQTLKKLASEVATTRQTKIFIETPYRNQQLIEQVLKTLPPDLHFCIAADLTLDTEYIATKRIGEWGKSKIPNLHKRPAIFLVGML